MPDDIKPAPPAEREAAPVAAEESPARELSVKERCLAGVPGLLAAGVGGYRSTSDQRSASTSACRIPVTITNQTNVPQSSS